MARELEKILVVDDEKIICRLLDNFLSGRGYQITTAGNGKEAISKLKTDRPHMIFLDINMPDMNGIEVLRIINETNIDAGVIMLSAFGDDTISKALKMGAYCYIQKPMELKRILEVLTAWQNLPNIRGTNDHC